MTSPCLPEDRMHSRLNERMPLLVSAALKSLTTGHCCLMVSCLDPSNRHLPLTLHGS
jgi:hypothetical protein